MTDKKPESFAKGITMIETSLSEEQTLFGYIKLKFEIKKSHFYAMLGYYVALGFSIFAFELRQQSYLLGSQFFNFRINDAAAMNSWIILFDTLILLIASPFYKTLVDKFGRRNMGFVGFGLISASFILPISFSGTPPWNAWYYLLRFLYANGIAISLSIPLLSDYIEHDSKGRCIALNEALKVLGFTLSTQLANSFNSANISGAFYLFTLIIFLAGNASCWFLKPGTDYYTQAVHSPDKHFDYEDENIATLQEATPIVMSKRRLAVQAIKSRPWILVTFMFSLMSGICFAINAQMLNIYSQSFSSFEGPRVRVGSSNVLKATVASLLVSLVLGPVLKYIKPFYGVIAGFAVIILSSFSTYTVDEAKSTALTLISVGFGVAYSFSQILSIYLGYENYPTALRATLFAAANACTTIGILLTTVIGGWLFTTEDTNWPFYIAGLSSFMSLALFAIIYSEMIIPAEKKIQNKQELNLSLLYTSIQTSNIDNEIDVNSLKLTE